MIYNNEVIIELYLLNFGVLMIPQESKDEPKKLNQVADASMKKTESSIQGYTFWEVLSFKLFTCCNKKSARYRQYRKAQGDHRGAHGHRQLHLERRLRQSAQQALDEAIPAKDDISSQNDKSISSK
jgi:hypothetical protein